MRTLAPFDVAQTPLAAGTTLIEASAGTGKTYTIAGLFLRLLLEPATPLAVGEILVTTYTKPATAELRDRIRKLIRSALDAFARGESDDPFLAAIVARHRDRAAEARERLEAAIRNFDQAAIYTIHGFCQRMLQDRAFESGLPFAAELVTDQTAIVQEIADDFWRAELYARDPFLTVLALMGKLSPNGLAKLLREVANKPLLEIEPAAGRLPALQAELIALFAELRQHWIADGHEIAGYFTTGNAWASGSHSQGKREKMEGALAAIGSCLSERGAPLSAFGHFDHFAQDKIAKAARKGAAAPTHEVFRICEKLRALRDDYVLALKAGFLAWARAELGRRKLARNVLSFDDLLTRLHEALRSPSGPALAGLMRARFRAALIDEFQDTDALQEAIFRRVFHGVEDGWLYLIGDPKQAIYGFRGADVFTYLEAADRASAGYTLGTNHRSESPLVAAVNALFSRSPKVFAIDRIDFRPVRAEGARDREPLTVAGRRVPPMQLWWWSDGDEPIKAADAYEVLPRFTAAQIAAMLAGAVEIGGRRVEPRDFAVLTWSNAQAQSVQAALAELGIPAVLHGTANVFHSPEAGDLHAILAAVAEPSRDDLLRAALATDTLGYDAAGLEALGRDERGWEAVLLRFQEHHEAWARVGFIQMFRAFLRAERVRPRLLGWRDGERRLTNLLHLSEALHRTACTRRLGAAALVKWLAEQRDPDAPALEEHELRLESDEHAVQVVTMHKSKGLQYNVVFCPFSWAKAERRSDESIVFHPPDDPGSLRLDLGSADEDAHAELAARERLAEHVRLLYVALTRARHQCHFVWGKFNTHEASAAAWVLHPPPASADPAAAFPARVKGLTLAQMRAELDGLVLSAPAAIAVNELVIPAAKPWVPEEPAPRELAPRLFRGRIERDWRVASFTSLTAAREDDQPDFDRVTAPAPPDDSTVAGGIHAFPRGMKAGVCFHEIFEKLDFRNGAAVDEAVARRLAAFGFDAPEQRAAMTACVRATLRMPLAPGLSLDQVGRSARLNELEFYFPFSRLEERELARLFGAAPTAVGRLRFEPQRGFIKGFIDLVFEHDGRFYIADWKSNWLGPDANAYTPEALAAEMARHHYALQYHLYVVALHRYLARRVVGYDYETHFGGVFYLFVRGGPGGVFHDRPRRALIEELSALFAREDSR